MFEVLERFVFRSCWIKSIKSCLSTPKFYVLINGSTHGFSSTRGIWQGDPISPFIFIIMAEALERSINILYQDGCWRVVNAANGVEHTNQLQFADDRIFSGVSSRCEAKTIKSHLEDYCKASGQSIN